jgi:PAS domain S-box-containing protein
MRTEPLAAINSVALAIGRFGSVLEMLDYALEKVLEVVQTEAGSVYLLDDARGELTLTVSRGLSEFVRRDFDRLRLGEGLSGRVAETGVPIVIRSLKDDPRLTRMAAREEGFRAFASVPLRSSFNTYGTLNIHTRADREFTEEDVQLLTSMAAQIALAVENARLFLELQASEQKFRSLVENAEDLIYQTDAQGHLTYVNPAVSTLLGRDPASLWQARTPLLSLVHPEDVQPVTDALGRMLDGEIMRAFQFRMVHADGETFRWVSQTNVPIRDDAGSTIGMQGIAHDVTERLAMQEQIAQAERLADHGRMAARIAHEIRNPLGAIVNSVNLLRRPGVNADPRLMQIVTEEADRLDDIIRQFLLFARPPARTPHPTDLETLVADTITLFRRDVRLPSTVRLAVSDPGELPLVVVDASQIRQVLWNLLKNAAEATETPGTIDVAIRRADEAAALVLTVIDDGPGVADPELIFEPFYTTRAQVNGLGLAVVERIVRDHGGTVSVRNVAGRGACFEMTLPILGCSAGVVS